MAITNKSFLDYVGLQALVTKIKEADAAVLSSAKTYTEERLGELGKVSDEQDAALHTVKSYVDAKFDKVAGDALVNVSVNGNEGTVSGNVAFVEVKAADIAIEDTDNNFEAEDVEAAFAEVAGMIADAISGSTVSVSTETTTAGMLKSYTFYQGEVKAENVIATIDIPKDFLVKSGSVVTLAEGEVAGKAAGTYLALVLNTKDSAEGTATNETIYINVGDLIEYVTSGSAEGDMVVITVSADHKVTAAITDGTVTKAKLHADVQASLDKADSAVQSVNGQTPDEDGAVVVKASHIEYKANTAEEGQPSNAVSVAAGIDAVDARIDNMDATPKQDASASQGLSLNLTQVDGVITAISGDIETISADDVNALF